MSQALYRKWRPQSWESVIGQEHVTQTLRNALTAGRTAHAYLFAGPRGTGKTTTARLLAKAVNCIHEDPAARPCGECDHCQAVNEGRFLDLIEIDAASNTSVEDVRDLRDKINFSPNQGKYKVYIIDEVHMLSTAAFNALLKTLEEPPPHAIFILATTEVHKIPATVLSRCQRHEFRRIPVNEIVAYLKKKAAEEQIEVGEDALALIARQATGAMRDAVSLLDQLSSSGKPITLESAQNLLGTATSQAVFELVEAMTAGEVSKGLDGIHAALDSGSDPRQFARQVVEYLRDLLLIQTGNAQSLDAAKEVRDGMARHASALTTQELLRIIRAFNFAAAEARSAWQPALPLEMAFVESVEPPASAVEARPAARTRPVQAQTPARSAASKPAAAAGEVKNSPPAENAAPESEPGATEVDNTDNDILFRQIMEKWRQITGMVRQESPHTQGLLNSGLPAGVKGNILFIGFNGEFAKTKMEKEENMDILRRVLAQAIGKEIEVRCFVSTNRRGVVPPEVDSDGMVAAALRDLGGEIVDIQ